jgi:hypothetical protein
MYWRLPERWQELGWLQNASSSFSNEVCFGS